MAASMAAGSAIATRVATSPLYLSRTSRSWFGATGRLASQYGYRGCNSPDMARSIAQRAGRATLDMVRHNSVFGGSETTQAHGGVGTMPEAAPNTYKLDRRALDFTLYEHLHIEQLFDTERYSHLSRAECDAVIEQCVRFVTGVTGPLNGQGDRVGCSFENGTVHTPAGVKAAWTKLVELG